MFWCERAIMIISCKSVSSQIIWCEPSLKEVSILFDVNLFFQSTYEYGKQLLQAALVLRRSLRYDLEPNHDLSRRLNQAWKRFSQGINERTARLNKVHIFNRNADIVSYQILILVILVQGLHVADPRGHAPPGLSKNL